MKVISRDLFPDNLILCGYRGSIAHGTYVPSEDPSSVDDIDLMGVYLAPPKYYIGLGRGKKYRKAIERTRGEYDVVSYELRKFVNLLLKANPNVLSLLWLRKDHYLKDLEDFPKWGSLLYDWRHIFLSRMAVYESFAGYARGQLKRMTHFHYEGYMGEKRKQLVSKFGYDVKNAAHLIRLLVMGIECLRKGRISVYRYNDRQIFIDIKRGEWSLEKVKKEADSLFSGMDNAYRNSPLPEEPDVEKAEEIVMQILREYLGVGYV